MDRFCKIILNSVLILFCRSAFAQTLIIDPNTDGGFEQGNTFAANGWTAVNAGNPSAGNNWYLTVNVLNNGNFSFTPTGSRAAYISQSDNGPWSYNINQYSTTHIYKNVSFPAGQELTELKFRWNAYGEGPVYDVLYVYSCPVTLTPVAGQPAGTGNSTANWSGTGTAQLHATLHSSPSSAGNTQEITLPASFAGTSRRLVFTWKNGNTLGFQPPAVLDSISLFADCHRPEVQLVDNTPNCSSTINISANVIAGTAAGTVQWYVNNVLVPGATGTSFTSNTVTSGSNIRCIYSSNNVCGYKDTADMVVHYGTHTHVAETLDVCSSDLPATWRGIAIPQGAVSNAIFATATVPGPGGCDSIIDLDLKVMPAPLAKTEYLSICRGRVSELQWRGRTIPGNARSSPFYDTAYAPSPNGCDSVIYLSLTVIEAAETDTGTITACGPVLFNGQEYRTSTTLYDTLRSLGGCDSVVNITRIVIDPFELSLNIKRPQGHFVSGQQITLEASAAFLNFQLLGWYPQVLFPDQMVSMQTIAAPADQEVFVVGRNLIGCIDTAYLHLRSLAVEPVFEMPNAFTPNGDGKNDFFGPVFRQQFTSGIVAFEIYDRWGKLVFSDHSGSAPKGWDGYFRGKAVDQGVYFYRITVTFADRTMVSRSGEVHLLR